MGDRAAWLSETPAGRRAVAGAACRTVCARAVCSAEPVLSGAKKQPYLDGRGGSGRGSVRACVASKSPLSGMAWPGRFSMLHSSPPSLGCGWPRWSRRRRSAPNRRGANTRACVWCRTPTIFSPNQRGSISSWSPRPTARTRRWPRRRSTRDCRWWSTSRSQSR